MKSEINMIRTSNNTSLLDSTTRLHYSPQGKTTCTACPVPCSTIGNSPVIRKKFGEPEIGSNSRTIIGQGITEALTDQQRQRGLLFVWGRRQRTGLAGYTEQNNHEICSSFISPKYQKRSRRIWCWQSRSLFTLTVISQKKTINWKHCTQTHTQKEITEPIPSISQSSMKRSFFPFCSSFPFPSFPAKASFSDWPQRSNFSASPEQVAS